ncbi:MAG: hypothetical protein KAS32_30455 [Candidatus Peribacteraceae bacterium]|nr:hypothetical protein [Candidatus Peribacteraceae bacterium]
MPKATSKNVLDLGGFIEENFTPVFSNKADLLAGIDKILTDNEATIRTSVGSTNYDNATHVAEIVKIEKYMAAADLWELRANIILGNTTHDESLVGQTEINRAKHYRNLAEKAETYFKQEILGVDGGVSFTTVESDHFS